MVATIDHPPGPEHVIANEVGRREHNNVQEAIMIRVGGSGKGRRRSRATLSKARQTTSRGRMSAELNMGQAASSSCKRPRSLLSWSWSWFLLVCASFAPPPRSSGSNRLRGARGGVAIAFVQNLGISSHPWPGTHPGCRTRKCAPLYTVFAHRHRSNFSLLSEKFLMVVKKVF